MSTTTAPAPAARKSGALINAPLPERPRAWRVAEFCRHYRVSKTSAYALMASGKLASVRVGGRRLIPADAAEALLGEAA